MTSAITLESLGAHISPPRTLQKGNGKLKCGASSSIEDRALSLLGAGVAAEQVANALGVTPGYISQLLADEVFSNEVATIRYENLQKHNMRDDTYDSLEDKLLEKLEASVPLMFKPDTLLKAISTINGAKRRGQAAPESVVNNNTIVTLLLPSVVAEKFSVNIDNQVTRAGDQELHTIPSGNLLKQIEDKRELRETLLDNNGEVPLDL